MPIDLTKKLVAAAAGWEAKRIPQPANGSEAHQAERRSAHLAIVCALKDPELDRTLEALDGGSWGQLTRDPEDPSRYYANTLELESGTRIDVVGAAPNHMGTTAAAILATKMILKFRPKLVLMVGIAGGVGPAGVGFGDILIADQTVDYGSGKVTTSSGKRVLRPGANPLPVNPGLLAHLKNRAATEDDCHSISKSWPGNRPATQLSAHIGTFGTNDLVVDDSETVTEISHRWRKLVAVEMETHAVHRACHEAVQPAPRFLAVKSASDLADKKSDKWRAYAAYTAAHFAASLIRNDWDSLVG